MKNTSLAHLRDYMIKYYPQQKDSSYLYTQNDFYIHFHGDDLSFYIDFGLITDKHFERDQSYVFRLYHKEEDPDLYNFYTFHNDIGINSILRHLNSSSLNKNYHRLFLNMIKECEMNYLNEQLLLSSIETKQPKL